MFQAVDTIVSLHFNRNDTLTVSKLEEEVLLYNLYTASSVLQIIMILT